MLVRIDNVNRLYVMRAGPGFSTMGWEYLDRQARAVALWLRIPFKSVSRGTREHFEECQHMMAIGAQHARQTGARCDAELSPQLIGLEGWRVEVEPTYGGTRRFIVGKSTGWLPCHLELYRINSHGGIAAEKEYKRVTRLYRVR